MRTEPLLVYADDAVFFAEALRQRFAQWPVLATTQRSEAIALLPHCEALVAAGPRVDDALLAAGPRLRWVHAITSGVETIVGSPKLPADAVVTSSRGIHGP